MILPIYSTVYAWAPDVCNDEAGNIKETDFVELVMYHNDSACSSLAMY